MTLPKTAMWACAIFLAVVFVFVGMLKLQGPSAIRWAERFAAWGYPASAQYVMGLLEICAGLGVLVPKLRRGAAATLVLLMAGALATHTIYAEFSRPVPPLLLGGIAYLVYAASPPGRV